MKTTTPDWSGPQAWKGQPKPWKQCRHDCDNEDHPVRRCSKELGHGRQGDKTHLCGDCNT